MRSNRRLLLTVMDNLKILLTTLVITMHVFTSKSVNAQGDAAKQEILNHGKAIREAFGNGDIDKIRSLHHPEVIKALAFNDIKNGRDEVINGLVGTLEAYHLAFIENNIESILVKDNIAIEQTQFVIQGIPKNEGDAFLFKGRTMVTYIRYDQSPTGWATIREIIQPATQ